MFDKSSSNNNLDLFTKKYHEYCSLFGLKQLIKCPTCVTCNSSSIRDHVLDSFRNRVSQSSVIDVGILDQQLIYCIRKTARIKIYCQKQIFFPLLKIIHSTKTNALRVQHKIGLMLKSWERNKREG